jgi:hypothetical protein
MDRRANHLSEILFVSPDLTRTLTAAGMPEFLEIAFLLAFWDTHGQDTLS